MYFQKKKEVIKKIYRRAFTLLEMLVIVVIIAIGGQVMFSLYTSIVGALADNESNKIDLSNISNINNLYAFSNNFFDHCNYVSPEEVECLSKVSGNYFNIKIVTQYDISRIFLEDTSNGKEVVLAKIAGIQISKKKEKFEMIQLTDTLTGLRYTTGTGKRYLMIFPYNN